MNKSDLINDMAKNTKGLTKAQAELAVNALLDSMKRAFKNEEPIKILGFGSFEVKERAARQGRNPKKPEEIIEIPAYKTIHFKVSKDLKKTVNE